LALFGKKQKDFSGVPGVIFEEDEILGYFDELFRQRLPVTIRTKESQWECNLYFIDVKNKLLRVEDSLGLKENQNKPVQCGFSLDRSWFLFQSKLIFFDDKPHLIMPAAIKHHDRRKSPRGSISPRENVRVSVLQSLGAGVGISGLASDASVGGISLVIERAIKMENEQKLTVHRDLLPKGTELMIVKVNRIPGVPPFEVPGILNRFFRQKEWKMAIEFPKIPGPIKAAIEKFVESRYIPFRPVKRSYQRRQEMERERERENAAPQEKQSQEIFQDAQLNPENFQDAELNPEKLQARASVLNIPDVPETSISIPDFNEEPGEEFPAEEETFPSEIEQPRQPMVLSIGEELKEALAFLENTMRILKFLRERKSGFLLLPPEYKEQSMLEYLEKISSMGVLTDVVIIVLSKEQISPKDMIKCRMLGIQHILPLQSSDQVLGIISAADSSQPGTPLD
jgi:hypothetical protein